MIEKDSRKEVKSLVLMLASSVVIAFIGVVALVYYIGQPGTYRLGQVLISPEVIKEISITDYDVKTGRGNPFLFDKIEFIKADFYDKGRERYSVNTAGYEEFYEQTRGLRSIPKISEETIASLLLIPPSTLTIFVRKKGEFESRTVFQEIEFFGDSDYFRVRLRQEEKKSQEWIYFKEPGIYKRVLFLFVPKAE